MRPGLTGAEGARAPADERAAALAFEAAMAALGPFEPRPLLLVGFSGGADSTVLLDLALTWADARSGRVIAAIVDHGLRAESAAEAEIARARASAMGAETRVLAAGTLGASAPRSGVQARARAARLAALRGCAREEGALHALLGHHSDDAAETAAMRRARGRPDDAGIAAVREEAFGRWLRPLLGVGKAELIAWAEARGLGWIEDPSNRDLAFERARLRAAAPPPAPSPAAGRARARTERARARALASRARICAGGILRLDGPTAEPERESELHRVIAIALTGGDQPAKRARAEGFARRLATGRIGGRLDGLGCRWTIEQAGVRPVARRAPPARPANAGPRPIAGPGFAGLSLSEPRSTGFRAARIVSRAVVPILSSMGDDASRLARERDSERESGGAGAETAVRCAAKGRR